MEVGDGLLTQVLIQPIVSLFWASSGAPWPAVCKQLLMGGGDNVKQKSYKRSERACIAKKNLPKDSEKAAMVF